MRIGLLALLLTGIACKSESASRSRQIVEIVGKDYAFQVPKDIKAGPTVFHFANHGKVRHELNVFLLKQGVTMKRFLDRRKANRSTRDLVDGPVGVLFADSGKLSNGGLSTELLAGREYGVICILKDNETAPRHFDMGMYTTFKVGGSGAQPAAVTETDTIIGIDYTFKYRDTLPPGRHEFVFDNRGIVQHEMILILLKKGVTTDSLLRVAQKNGDTDALIDDAPGLLTALAGSKSLGRLEIDLLPGREYTLACFYSDSQNAPPHVALGMYGRIHVAAAQST